MRSVEMAKFSRERCVCAPHRRSAGTSMGPKVSFSIRTLMRERYRAQGRASCSATGGARADAIERAIEAGVDHIDTSDAYGPHVANQIIQEAPAN